MCGCNAPIVSESEVPQGKIAIPLKSVINDDFGAILLNAWCMNPKKVQAAFKEAISEDIQENQLPDLITVHKAGNDLKEYNKNFLWLVKSINFTDAERNKPNCPFVYTV